MAENVTTTPAENDTNKLGLLDSSTILIGGMVGSAIFSLSGVTIATAGPASLISWVVAGAILFVYGLLNAELSTIYPNSGGVFMFPAKSLGKTEKQGRLWGWISSWAYLFGCFGGAAFSAIYVSIYLGVSFESLNAFQIPLAIAAVVICGVLNIFNIAVTGKASTVLTLGLVATMLLFIVVGLFSGSWDASRMAPFFTQGSGGAFGFMGAIPVAMVAYGSIVAVAFMVGEIRDPNKNVPRAMTIAMIVVMALYILVMLTTLGLVSAGMLSEMHMEYIPLYAAAFTTLAHISWLKYVISVAAVLALMTTILVLITLSARTVQAAASFGVLPRALAKNNEKTKTPITATLVVTAVLAVLSAFPSATNFIVNLGALCNAIVVVIICITILQARKRNPGKSAFKAPGGTVVPVITLVVIVACYIPDILAGGWQLWAWTVGYFALGMIIYFIGTGYYDKKASPIA